MKIANKIQFYRLWNAGALGNRPRTWSSAKELQASGWTGPVVIRSAVIPGWETRYDVPVLSALFMIGLLTGVGVTLLNFSVAAAGEKLSWSTLGQGLFGGVLSVACAAVVLLFIGKDRS